MAESGQLEPIIVRKIGGMLDDLGGPPLRYQILSGETRWLAAKKLGWTEIDGRVRRMHRRGGAGPGREANGQRKDLNPIERAELIEQLCKPVAEGGNGLTKDAAAKRVGLKDGSSASNLVRLLKLPKVWQDRVAAGELPESFARLIVPVIELGPVLDGLEKDWKSKDKPRESYWAKNAFDSRANLEEAIESLH
jgi:ParB family chromosome partitioning protein